MRTTFSLVFLSLFVVQLSYSQLINYEQITLIVVGEDYSKEDIQIIKGNIKTDKDKEQVLKLLSLDNMLNEKFVDQATRSNPCEKYDVNFNQNKKKLKLLGLEIQELNNKYTQDKTPENGENLNKKIEIYNALKDKQNLEVANFNSCIDQKKRNKDEFIEISDVLYKAYSLKKNAIANEDVDD